MLHKFDEKDFPELFKCFSPLDDMKLFIKRYDNEVVPELNNIETQSKREYPNLDITTKLFNISCVQKQSLTVVVNKAPLFKMTEVEDLKLYNEIDAVLNKVRNTNYHY